MSRPTMPTQVIRAVTDDETVLIGRHALSEPKVDKRRSIKGWLFIALSGLVITVWTAVGMTSGGPEPAAPPAVVTSSTSVGLSPTPTTPDSSTATTAAPLPTPTPVVVTETVYESGPTVYVTRTVTATVTATVTETVTPPPSPTPTPTEPPQ